MIPQKEQEATEAPLELHQRGNFQFSQRLVKEQLDLVGELRRLRVKSGKKAGPETFKRQVEKELGSGGVHVKATRDL